MKSETFTPISSFLTVDILCLFPVENIEYLLTLIEGRRQGKDLEQELINEIQAQLKDHGELRETCMYVDLIVTVKIHTTEYSVVRAVQKACKVFWGKNRIGKTPEYRKQFAQEFKKEHGA